jgi:plasmid stabilization system protein ParE
VDWYRENSEQAASDFLREVDGAIESIAAGPLVWTEYLYGTRRYVLRHFPYLVVYLLHDDQVKNVASAHGRRRPGYWSKRVVEH